MAILKEVIVHKWSLLLILIFPISGFSQTPTSTPAPTPVPVATPRQTPGQTLQRSREFESLRTEESIALAEEQRQKAQRHKLATQMVDELYRKPSKKELLLVSIDNELQNKFADFLKQDDTGIIKFLNQSKCSNSANVVQANEDCLENTMPGAGASYSFRTNTYRIPQLADLSFTENTFITVGNWIHGLLLEIGDVSLDKLSLQTSEVAELSSFPPASKFETAKEIDLKLLEGIKYKDKIYRRLTPARENTTYLLRSIAYRGTIYKTAQGFVYNELDYDKRKDILVAFRVVKIDSEGNATILWKQLAVKDAPKIVQPKPSKDETKENNFAGKN